MIPKIWRAPYSNFGETVAEFPDDRKDETYTAVDHYSDEVCKEIRDNGFNGIWLYAQFVHLVPGDFPELAPHVEEHQERLARLIDRCGKFGLKVYLYGQVLRSVSEANQLFWKKHPACAGEIEYATELLPDGSRHRFPTVSLCPSVEEVRNHVKKSSRDLARLFPELGGVILITANEFPGHCYQRRKKYNPDNCYKMITCPRCSRREPWEVVADLITLFRDGFRENSSRIKLIVWNWSWSMWLPHPCRELLELLPENCILMADFERGGSMDLPERKAYPISEYSLMYPGPSEEFTLARAVCCKKNIPVMSKLQLGTTHELGSVVSIPNIISIYRKGKWHREHPETGFMGCWNFGNFFSANTAAFHYFCENDHPDEESALKNFAERFFPGCDPEKAVNAWKLFYEAMKFLPFSIGPLYYGIIPYAPGSKDLFVPGPLSGSYAGTSYQHFPVRGDDLAPALEMHEHEFSLAEIIRGYGKCAGIWDSGVMLLEQSLKTCSSPQSVIEFGNAVICGCCWNSAENGYRIYSLRQNWDDEKIFEFKHILTGEISVLERMLPFIQADPRQGYHGEAASHMFDEKSVQEKISFLRKQLTANSI